MFRSFINRVAVTLLLLFSGWTLAAQTDGTYSGFSPYSVFGVGQLHQPGTAWNRSMGGVGIAARNNRYINILNPASMTARDSLSFMADFGLGGRISLFSEGNKKALNTTFNIDDFVMSFPLWKHTAAMVGITPISDVGYKIVYAEMDPDAQYRTFTSKGNGGIYQVFAAFAGTFWNRLSIGAQANYCFGNINKQATVDYDVESFRDIASGDSLQVNNFTAKLGIQYEQPLGDKFYLTLGATYRMRTRLGQKFRAVGQAVSYLMCGIYGLHAVHIIRKKPDFRNIACLAERMGMDDQSAVLMNKIVLFLNRGVLYFRMRKQPLFVKPVDQKVGALV